MNIESVEVMPRRLKRNITGALAALVTIVVIPGLLVGIPIIAAASSSTCTASVRYVEPFTREGLQAPLVWVSNVRYDCDTEPPTFVPGVLSNPRITWELEPK